MTIEYVNDQVDRCIYILLEKGGDATFDELIRSLVVFLGEWSEQRILHSYWGDDTTDADVFKTLKPWIISVLRVLRARYGSQFSDAYIEQMYGFSDL